ncbi:phenylalanine--tRNA ligase subunit beta [Rhodococcus sp. X156]|uniref:phenylalanine--tRNA ligase subunit beta n=1 Tax=Rhodococcus sp. X156 TaxID=2499145 RepID=UPI001F49D37E|nr:phenylalanine--tRNA ligase subunit beta [Rhodococcus sp. X156]
MPTGALPDDAVAVSDAFVRVGLELEELFPPADLSGPVVLGRVAEITELTDFKKPIRYCQVDVGNDEPQNIVCGATNFAVGDLVVVALPGSELPGGFAIASRKTYGHVSDGMICSARELGVGGEHSGILVLPAGTGTPGEDAVAALGLDDTVIELNITPDRGYCFSVRGLGRELASAYDVEFTDRGLAEVPASAGDAWPATLEPEALCARFVVRRVTGIDPAATTPWWLQRRLILAGMRPISAAVDVTNYVMLELGQPLHAFDAATVQGPLVVRKARRGEKLSTLDGVVRTLDPDDVVICDDSGPVSLAGVMGGASTEVGPQTTDVLLEAATWDPLSIARTARRHKLPSEASKRFERAVDPAVAAVALERAAQLLAEIAGGTVQDGRTDEGGVSTPASVTMAADRPDQVAGTSYPEGTTARRLRQVGCTVAGTGTLTVTPPTWRPDITQPADLVEEVLRLEGLDTIPSVLPAAPAGRGLTPSQRRRRAVSKALASAGYVEVLPTPFLPAGVFDAWGLAAEDPLRNTAAVLNPLEADRGQLATTVLPALLEAMQRNVSRGQRDVSLFGVAQVVQPAEGTTEPTSLAALPVDRRPSQEEIDALLVALPRQPVHVGVVLCGQRERAGWWGPGRAAETADAIAAAQSVARASGVELTVRQAQQAPWHPGRCAALVVDGEVVGHAGELHPAVCERAGLPPRTCAMELNLDAVPVREVLVAPVVSPFPPVLQDVALVVDAAVPAGEVELALRAGGGELLEDVRLFDVYTGKQVGEGKRSLAFALRFRATDRTLTEDEASLARDAAVDAATAATGALLRG